MSQCWVFSQVGERVALTTVLLSMKLPEAHEFCPFLHSSLAHFHAFSGSGFGSGTGTKGAKGTYSGKATFITQFSASAILW